MNNAVERVENRSFKIDNKQTPLLGLLSDVNSLALADLTLLAACDTLAGTCESLIHIHGGPSRPSDLWSQGKDSSMTSAYPEWRTSEITAETQRGRGEGESADEITTEGGLMKETKGRRSKYKRSLETTSLQQNIPVLTDKALFQRIEMLHKGSFEMSTEEKSRQGSHLCGDLSSNKQTTNYSSTASMKRISDYENGKVSTSTPHAFKSFQNEHGLLKRIETSSELTSKLNSSMEILRRELDRIFDSSLSIADAKPQHSDISNYWDLDKGASVEPISPSGPLNLSDQGYFSDGNTLDLLCIQTLVSPGAKGECYPSTKSTQLDPPPRFPSKNIPSPPKDSSATSPLRLYPEGIVRNPLSPRSAFKKVVRFS